MPFRAAESFDKFHANIELSVRVLAGIVLLVGILPAQERLNATGVPSRFNIQAQTACETEMLREMGAREVLSGKGYEALTEVARGYGRAIPHIYMEADADALAARTLGRKPLKAFLQRVLALTHGQNWDAKHRLEVLQ